MRVFVDFIAILLMGDGLAKAISPQAHNRFYQFRAAPAGVNNMLEYLARHPLQNTLLALAMISGGAWLSRHTVRQST